MSGFGDYLDEMDRIRTSDAEIERLLSGAPAVGSDLQPLADLFAALRAGSEDALADDVVAGYVTAATTSVVSAPVAVVVPPRQGRSLLPALRRRAATIAVAATVFVGGTGGLAVAADGAKPGDALYGVDRALEAVGIGAGAEHERLSEAAALVNVGEVRRGLQHAAEALEDNEPNGSGAAEALMEAATRVSDAGAAQSAATREGVAGLLAYLSMNAGDIDGSQVAELAGQIGRQGDRPSVPGSPDNPGPPDHAPANPPGQDKAEPGPPDHTPANPPGQDKAEPGPPGDVPADPPGLSDDKPGRPDPPRNTP